MTKSIPVRAIAQLIVVLQIGDELMSMKPKRRPAMRPPAMRRMPPSVNERPLHRGGNVLQRAEIFVVAIALASEQAMKRVMNVVAPLGINSVAPDSRRPDYA